MKTDEKIIEILKEAGVLLEGHFLLTSGRHSDKYMQCARIFQHAKYSEALCKMLADKFTDAGIDIVVGPAMGAVQMAYEVGRCLGVENMFAERIDGVMTLRRNFSIRPNQKVLVVEDVVTTGGSVREVMDLIKQLEGEVVGVGVIVDRSNGKLDFGVRMESVHQVDIKSFEPERCPLCEKEIPLVKPGSRTIFKLGDKQ